MLLALRISFAVTVSLSFVACSGDNRPPTVQAEEVNTFNDLVDMVKNSDVIVQGTVVAVSPGRTVGDPGGDEAQLRQVMLGVDRQLYGSAPVVVLIEEGFGVPPESSRGGDTGIYFLHRKADSPPGQTYYRLASSQGRFLFDGSTVIASNPELSWVESLEGLSPVQLQERVEQAIDKATGQP